MYRSVLASQSNDLEVIERLAHLLAVEDRVPELLTLRQIQLGLETDTTKKLELRLELAKLVGIVEERGGRLDALRANLEDFPGHDASIDAIAGLLSSKGQHRQLADLLENQAQRLETANEPSRAAKLWSRYAQVAEVDCKEIDRAIAGHRRRHQPSRPRLLARPGVPGCPKARRRAGTRSFRGGRFSGQSPHPPPPAPTAGAIGPRSGVQRNVRTGVLVHVARGDRSGGDPDGRGRG
jgi:hypothetical protein